MDVERFSCIMKTGWTRRSGILVVIILSVSNGIAQRNVSPVGCFQNLKEIHGDIFGFGVMKIWRNRKGDLRGSFSERRTELGEHFDPTPLRNIRYDAKKRVLTFDITFNDPIYTRRNAKSAVTQSGITVDVGKKIRAEYQGPNPLFRRKYRDCF